MITSTHQQALFDKGQFRADLTLSDNPVPAYKKRLAIAAQTLEQWFEEGEPIETLVHGRAWFIDQMLTFAWQTLFAETDDSIALLAVGGYGRGELHPHSDIDILLLLATDDYDHHQQPIGAFLTLLWDIGLTVGASVRSLAECQQQAKGDITIITNLMEARTIVGPVRLQQQLNALITTDQLWPSEQYLRAKLEEQRLRHRKFNDTEYDLEPNLKGSPGGLRDLHVLTWVAQRHYGTVNLTALKDRGFLRNSELRLYIESRAFLWKVRWALHTLTGRCEDRLLFDHQRELARILGYNNKNRTLAVERFMQDYYRTAMNITQLKDLLLQYFNDDIINHQSQRKTTPINAHFQRSNDYLELTHAKVFSQHPPAMLELFVLLSQDATLQGFTAQTIRQLQASLHLIDDHFRSNPLCHQHFLTLMSAPKRLSITLQRMVRYGVLARYLPAFSHIIGQMQFDLFHTLTVDAHTLLLIRFLQRFSNPEAATAFPVASQLIHTINNLTVLQLAGLFHDIAKGRGGDHSQLGADIARQFSLLHQLSDHDAQLLSWLVEQHLLLSITAQKKDLTDPVVIQDFARAVGTVERLNYLYLLTVADINATNPNLWNGWRASLLQQLFLQTQQMLNDGIDNTVELQVQVEQTQQEAMTQLLNLGCSEHAVESLWQQFPQDYFLRHQSDEIAWHTQGILQHKGDDSLILIQNPSTESEQAHSSIFIYSVDRPNLFATTVIALHKLALAIQDARILTADNHFSLDTYTVLEEDGQAILGGKERCEEIRRLLLKHLNQPHQLPRICCRRTPRQLRHFRSEPVVTIHSQLMPRQTIIQITATDRPGLLALIGKTFATLKLNILGAKAATFGEKIDDTFVISDHEQRPIESATFAQEIVETLQKALHDAAIQDSVG